eukprot:3108437-Pyramimonas_sp.AAC.1
MTGTSVRLRCHRAIRVKGYFILYARTKIMSGRDKSGFSEIRRVPGARGSNGTSMTPSRQNAQHTQL